MLRYQILYANFLRLVITVKTLLQYVHWKNVIFAINTIISQKNILTHLVSSAWHHELVGVAVVDADSKESNRGSFLHQWEPQWGDLLLLSTDVRVPSKTCIDPYVCTTIVVVATSALFPKNQRRWLSQKKKFQVALRFTYYVPCFNLGFIHSKQICLKYDDKSQNKLNWICSCFHLAAK